GVEVCAGAGPARPSQPAARAPAARAVNVLRFIAAPSPKIGVVDSTALLPEGPPPRREATVTGVRSGRVIPTVAGAPGGGRGVVPAAGSGWGRGLRKAGKTGRTRPARRPEVLAAPTEAARGGPRPRPPPNTPPAGPTRGPGKRGLMRRAVPAD